MILGLAAFLLLFFVDSGHGKEILCVCYIEVQKRSFWKIFENFFLLFRCCDITTSDNNKKKFSKIFQNDPFCTSMS